MPHSELLHELLLTPASAHVHCHWCELLELVGSILLKGFDLLHGALGHKLMYFIQRVAVGKPKVGDLQKPLLDLVAAVSGAAACDCTARLPVTRRGNPMVVV